MLKDIDHIAIKVSDIDSVCDDFSYIGYECSSVEQYDEVGMKIAFLGKGDSHLELLEVTDSASPIVDDPAGMHHLGLKVEDIDKAYGEMSRSERFLIEGSIRQGARGRIFFFRLKSEREVLFECAESVKR